MLTNKLGIFPTAPSPLRGGQGGVQTGKELDDETGYSYFGARYYDPNTSIWLSVV